MAAPHFHFGKACSRTIPAATSGGYKVNLLAFGCAAFLIESLAPAEAVKKVFHPFAWLAPVDWRYKDDTFCATEPQLYFGKNIIQSTFSRFTAFSPPVPANKAGGDFLFAQIVMFPLAVCFV
jgi:hypothetical protein